MGGDSAATLIDLLTRCDARLRDLAGAYALGVRVPGLRRDEIVDACIALRDVRDALAAAREK